MNAALYGMPVTIFCEHEFVTHGYRAQILNKDGIMIHECEEHHDRDEAIKEGQRWCEENECVVVQILKG